MRRFLLSFLGAVAGLALLSSPATAQDGNRSLVDALTEPVDQMPAILERVGALKGEIRQLRSSRPDPVTAEWQGRYRSLQTQHDMMLRHLALQKAKLDRALVRSRGRPRPTREMTSIVDDGLRGRDVKARWRVVVEQRAREGGANPAGLAHTALRDAGRALAKSLIESSARVLAYAELAERIRAEIKAARDGSAGPHEAKDFSDALEALRQPLPENADTFPAIAAKDAETIEGPEAVGAYVDALEKMLDDAETESQQTNIQLQVAVQDHRKTLRKLASLQKTLQETAASVIRNLG